jgi:hypothetical protein
MLWDFDQSHKDVIGSDVRWIVLGQWEGAYDIHINDNNLFLRSRPSQTPN